MVQAAILFFVLALVSIVFGAYGIAGITFDFGKILLMVFLCLSLLSFVGGLFSGRKKHMP